jgi:hypothetical protein
VRSLWLVPAEPRRTELAALIERLAAGSHPVFAPHVTLLPSLPADTPDVRPAVGALAAALGPFTLRLAGETHSDDFFRCVVLEAELAPPLLFARGAAERVLDLAPPEPYRPHLSLVYGHLPPPERAALAAEARTLMPLPLDVTAAALELWDTSDDVPRWTREATFPLA